MVELHRAETVLPYSKRILPKMNGLFPYFSHKCLIFSIARKMKEFVMFGPKKIFTENNGIPFICPNDRNGAQ